MSSLINEASVLLSNSKNFIVEQETKLKSKEQIKQQLEDIEKELGIKVQSYDDMVRAAAILGNVADENTQMLLSRITTTINNALGILFENSVRKIEIVHTMYQGKIPHFIVELEVENGVKRTFKQSGSGLAQIISFLFTISLIAVRGGRQIMIMDEILNGLHPSAKIAIKDIISIMQDFQFVIVEHSLDIGKQYEVVKHGSTAKVSLYEGEGYYKDLN